MAAGAAGAFSGKTYGDMSDVVTSAPCADIDDMAGEAKIIADKSVLKIIGITISDYY